MSGQSRRTTADDQGAARGEILARLVGAVEKREAIREAEREINAEIRGLIVEARDAETTVGAIAERIGVTRAAVYDFMRNGSGSDGGA